MVNRCCLQQLHGWVFWQLLTALPIESACQTYWNDKKSTSLQMFARSFTLSLSTDACVWPNPHSRTFGGRSLWMALNVLLLLFDNFMLGLMLDSWIRISGAYTIAN